MLNYATNISKKPNFKTLSKRTVYKEIHIAKKITKQLLNDHVVCFPVDTVMALAASSESIFAIKKLYSIKKRNKLKSVSVFIPGIDNIESIAQVNTKQLEIIKRYSNMPVTWILNTNKNNKIIAPTGNLNSIGIRLPISPLIAEVMKTIKKPIFATSVNISNQKASKNIKDVSEYFFKKCKIFNSLLERPLGYASRVVDIRNEEFIVLR